MITNYWGFNLECDISTQTEIGVSEVACEAKVTVDDIGCQT